MKKLIIFVENLRKKFSEHQSKACSLNTETIQFTSLLWTYLHYVTASAPVIQLPRVPLIIKPN
jgi:hypothetical protein